MNENESNVQHSTTIQTKKPNKTWAMRHMNKQLLYPWRAWFTCDISIKMVPTVNQREEHHLKFDPYKPIHVTITVKWEYRTTSNIESCFILRFSLINSPIDCINYLPQAESTNRYMDSILNIHIFCHMRKTEPNCQKETIHQRLLHVACAKRKQKENKSKRKKGKRPYRKIESQKHRLNERVVIYFGRYTTILWFHKR